MIWITGLSGAGKTSLAQALVRRLRSDGRTAFLVDGDDVRRIIDDPSTEHDRDSRIKNAYRVARFAQLVETQGYLAVVSTMSLFHEIHQWNRQSFDSYLEVLLDAEIEIIEQRDPRGLYQRASRGEAENVVGLDLAVEKPKSPHLVLDANTRKRDPASDQDQRAHVDQILRALERA